MMMMVVVVVFAHDSKSRSHLSISLYACGTKAMLSRPSIHVHENEKASDPLHCTSPTALASKASDISARARKNQNHLAAHLFSPTCQQPIAVIPTYTYIRQNCHLPIPKLLLQPYSKSSQCVAARQSKAKAQ